MVAGNFLILATGTYKRRWVRGDGTEYKKAEEEEGRGKKE